MKDNIKKDVAIIGMSCKFANVNDYREYWELLKNGMSGISLVPNDRWENEKYYSSDLKDVNKTNSKWLGVIEDYDLFYNSFFNITNQEAEKMDPQQRLLLEETWKCIEDSGYSLDVFQSSITSVYVGSLTHDFLDETLMYNSENDAYSSLGTFGCMLSNRVSYVFDLKGNSYTIEAACTSGLVGIHQAKDAIIKGECDYAIVAGVNLSLNPWRQISYSKAHMLSSEGKSKAFAQDADGFVSGDGIAVLLLGDFEKAKKENANIYGIIRGTSVTHVGKSMSLTAPSVAGQRKAAEIAFKDAGIKPDSVSYLECHGTGTIIGDTMEIEAMKQAYSQNNCLTGFCKIGSEKTNIGHTEAASGIAAIIKVLLMMKNKSYVPSINCNELNPLIKFDKTPFLLADKYEKWKKRDNHNYIAAVNGFGFGGVNSHIVLEEYVEKKDWSCDESTGDYFVISAKTRNSLLKNIREWERYLSSDEAIDKSISAICQTMCCGREHMRFRAGVIVRSKEELMQWIKNFKDEWIIDSKAGKEKGFKFDKKFEKKAIEYYNSRNIKDVKIELNEIITDEEIRNVINKDIDNLNYDSVILRIYVCQRMFDYLIGNNIEIKYICESGKEYLWNALISSGIISEQQVYGYLLGMIKICDMDVRLAQIPFYDMVSDKKYKKIHFDREYFVTLKNKAKEIVELFVENSLFAGYCNDIESLKKFQRSFQKGYREWEKIFNFLNADLNALFDKIKSKKSDNIFEKVVFIILTMQIKNYFQKKYELSDEYKLDKTVLGEVVQLIQNKIIEKEDIIRFFLLDTLTAEQLEEKANLNSPLDSQKEDYPMLTEMGINYFIDSNQFEEMVNGILRGKECISGDCFEINEENLLLFFFLNGSNINWKKIYNNYPKLSLPTYSFDGERFGLYHNKKIGGDGEKMNKEQKNVKGIDLNIKICDYLVKMFDDVLKIKLCDNQYDANFIEEFNISSLELMALYQFLEKDFDDFSPAVIYEYPSINMLKEYLIKYYHDRIELMFVDKMICLSNENDVNDDKSVYHQKEIVKEKICLEANDNTSYCSEEDIAIIGLSGRYPRCSSPEKLWELILKGENVFIETPAERWNNEEVYSEDKDDLTKSYTKWGGYLEDYDKFDSYFFNIAPAQAKLMDPQQRIFLEVAYEALEDAGYTKETIGYNVGVFVGATTNTYGLIAAEETARGNVQCVDNDLYDISNRVSYFMDWKGPSITLDSACSSSLTAIHFGVNAIRNGDCEEALVGGVSLTLHPNRIIQFCNKRMLLDGKEYYPFGNGDGGFVDSEGAGAILLKKYKAALKDHDYIYGVIKGTAVNAGGKTSGYTVPSPKAQAELISKAIEKSKINPRTIQYVEAHGTGTKLGDPIEIQGLTEAYRKYTNDSCFCSIGSVKSNIGHTIAAAGIAGTTKVLLQLKHKMLVKSLYGSELNPMIKFKNTPFYVQSNNEEWKKQKIDDEIINRRAAVSAFGAGGSNAHIILEGYDNVINKNSTETVIFVLSAKTKERLRDYVEKYIDFFNKCSFEDDFSLADMAYTLQIGREAFEERIAIVTNSIDELRISLEDYYNERANKNIYIGNSKSNQEIKSLFDDDNGINYIKSLIESKKFEKIASLWSLGIKIEWELLYKEKAMCRIPLPTYPFEKISYWIPIVDNKKTNIISGKTCLAESKPFVDLKRTYDSSIVYKNGWAEINVHSNSAFNGEKIVILSTDLNGRISRAFSKYLYYKNNLEIYDINQVDLINICQNHNNFIMIVENDTVPEIKICEFAFELSKNICVYCHQAKVSVITHNNHMVKDDDVINPIGSSLLGFFSVIEREELLDVCICDIDDKCIDSPYLCLNLLNNRSDNNEDVFFAIRNDKVYTRRLMPMKIAKQSNVKFRENGTYIVIGGAGALGTQICVMLARYYHTNIVIIGRKNKNEMIQQLINKVDSEGGRCIYVQGDAADRNDLEKAIDIAEKNFGKIYGVLNLAMMINYKLFKEMESIEFTKTLRSKISTSVALANAFKHKNLDFILAFSSIQSYSNNIGFLDYSSGCTFEDSYMFYLKTNNIMNAKVINLGYLGELSEQSSRCDKKTFEMQGQKALTIEELFQVIVDLISSSDIQTVVFRGDDRYKKRLKAIDEEKRDLNTIYTQLSRICEMHILYEFNKYGMFCEKGEIFYISEIIDSLRVKRKFEKTLIVLLETLERAGFISIEGDKLITLEKVNIIKSITDFEQYSRKIKNEYSEIAPHIELSLTAINNMMRLLCEDVDAIDVFFGDGSCSLIDKIYKENEFARFYGEIACNELEDYILKKITILKPTEKIKIVEVGAGVGGISYYLFPMLQKYSDKIKYIYTDISKSFLKYGIEHYKYDFIEFDVLNIEEDPKEQLQIGEGADVLVASNVLHATKYMKKTMKNVLNMMKNDGKIILNEMNDMFAFLCPLAIFLDGWWLFNDEEIRVHNSPLLSIENWKILLSENGFKDIKIKCNESIDKKIWNEHIITATLEKKNISETIDLNNKMGSTNVRNIIRDAIIDILEIDRFHIEENMPFSEMGVDSINSRAIVARLNKELATNIKVTDLFAYSTINMLSDYVDSCNKSVKCTANEESALIEKNSDVNSENNKSVINVIKAIVMEILNIDERHFDYNKPFSEMGVDSIISRTIVNRLNKELSADIKITDLFVYSTVALLSEYINSNYIIHNINTSVADINNKITEDDIIDQLIDKFANDEADISDICSLLEE